MDNNEIHFPILPMPPSSNHQYKLVRNRSGKTIHAASRELRIFKSEFVAKTLCFRNFFIDAKKTVHDWLETGHVLRLETYFFFKPDRVWTKKDSPRKTDVTNRIKAFDDCLCDALEICDSTLFQRLAEKRCAYDVTNDDYVMAFLSPVPIIDTGRNIYGKNKSPIAY